MVVGHQKQLDFLYQSSLNGRLAHAYLFEGPSRIGKKTAALEWLSHLLSSSLKEGKAHPDFFYVAPLLDEKTGLAAKEIEIGQIRDLIGKLQLKPVAGAYKAVLIDQAHFLNFESQSALLKTLEEPPGKTIIVLITDNSRRLLQTIVSRTVVVKFNFVSKKDLMRFAKARNFTTDQGRLDLMLDLSLGRPGRLIDFANQEGRLEDWLAKIKQFERVLKSGIPQRFSYIKQITDVESGEDLNELLEIWQFYFRQKMLDSLSIQCGKAGPCHTGQGPALAQTGEPGPKFVFTKGLQKNNPTEKIAANLEKINNLIMLISQTNVNERLALENLMLDL